MTALMSGPTTYFITHEAALPLMMFSPRMAMTQLYESSRDRTGKNPNAPTEE